MAGDYAEQLRREGRGAHAVFHSLILSLAKIDSSTVYLFFEGEDDPAFYMPHIRHFFPRREFSAFICFGRSEVLKTVSLVIADGRAVSRCLFFIDKDHSDILNPSEVLSPQVFQTEWYSIENYVVGPEAFSAFWVEVLHLDSGDVRLPSYLNILASAREAFERRALVLMSLVLMGRGVDGLAPRKLNLNNANLELVLNVNAANGGCAFRRGGGKHFAVSTNVCDYPGRNNSEKVKKIANRHLRLRRPKEYIRGKYELWFFVKFLNACVRELSSKESARKSGLRRATPKVSISFDSAVELLSARVPCPKDLELFLNRRSIEFPAIVSS